MGKTSRIRGRLRYFANDTGWRLKRRGLELRRLRDGETNETELLGDCERGLIRFSNYYKLHLKYKFATEHGPGIEMREKEQPVNKAN
jgi:hypothetical protein